jgi:hypothetical protein
VTDHGLNLSLWVAVLEQCGVDRCGCSVSTFTHGVTHASPYCCHCHLAHPLCCHHVVCHQCHSCMVCPHTAATVQPAQLQPLGLHLLSTATTALGSPISLLLPPSSPSSPTTAWLPTLAPCHCCLAHSLLPPLMPSSPFCLAVVVMLLGLPFLAYCCHCHLAHRLPGITSIWPTHFCCHSSSLLTPM